MTPSKLPASAPDHDRLIRIETLVDELHEALMGGNGQGGLVRDVVSIRSELDEVKLAVPSAREKMVFKGGTLGVIATLAAIIANLLGIDLSSLKGQ